MKVQTHSLFERERFLHEELINYPNTLDDEMRYHYFQAVSEKRQEPARITPLIQKECFSGLLNEHLRNVDDERYQHFTFAAKLNTIKYPRLITLIDWIPVHYLFRIEHCYSYIVMDTPFSARVVHVKLPFRSDDSLQSKYKLHCKLWEQNAWGVTGNRAALSAIAGMAATGCGRVNGAPIQRRDFLKQISAPLMLAGMAPLAGLSRGGGYEENGGVVISRKLDSIAVEALRQNPLQDVGIGRPDSRWRLYIQFLLGLLGENEIPKCDSLTYRDGLFIGMTRRQCLEKAIAYKKTRRERIRLRLLAQTRMEFDSRVDDELERWVWDSWFQALPQSRPGWDYPAV